MPKPRSRRLVRQPRIQWRQRLKMRHLAPPLVVATVVLVLLLSGGLAVSRGGADTPPTPTTVALVLSDPMAAVVGSTIQNAEFLGQLKPALPSSVLFASPTPVPTFTPLPTPTPSATSIPTATLTPTPNYVVSEARLPVIDWDLVSRIEKPVERAEAAFLEPMAQVFQKEDVNESPSVAAMVLSFYGLDPQDTFEEAQEELPLDDESRVALPGKLIEFFEKRGLQARIFEGVTLEQLQALVTNGIPVIVAQALLPGSDVPHYRVVRGYSDRRGVVLVNDSEFAANLSFSYAEFSEMWDPYNGFAMPLFLPRQAEVVKSILGEEGDKTAEYVERGRKLGQPSSEVVVEPTPRASNSGADSAWSLTLAEPLSGSVLGNGGGAYGFLRIQNPPANTRLKIEMQYTPDDPLISRAVGFKVYGPHAQLIGEAGNVTGRGGERTLVVNTKEGEDYLIQVYNYRPGMTLEYTLIAVHEGQTPPPVTRREERTSSNGPKPSPSPAPPPPTAPSAYPAPQNSPQPASTATPAPNANPTRPSR